MGTIADIVNLIEKLDSSVKDRKILDMIYPIKVKFLELQREQFQLEQKHAKEITGIMKDHGKEITEMKKIHTEEMTTLTEQKDKEIAVKDKEKTKLQERYSDLQEKHLNQPRRGGHEVITFHDPDLDRVKAKLAKG